MPPPTGQEGKQASRNRVGGGPGPEWPWAFCRVTTSGKELKEKPQERAWGVGSDLVLEAVGEVAHEEVGLIAL